MCKAQQPFGCVAGVLREEVEVAIALLGSDFAEDFEPIADCFPQFRLEFLEGMRRFLGVL